MLFSSIVFLFTFLPVVLILYYVLPAACRNPVLLLASLVFYAWGEPVYIFLMILSILFNYISGLDIARNLENKKKAKRSLVFNIIVNIAIRAGYDQPRISGAYQISCTGTADRNIVLYLPDHVLYHRCVSWKSEGTEESA